MTAPPPSLWRSPDGLDNALALQVNNPQAFEALSEIDALGHRLLARASGTSISTWERLVGVAMLRRAVTLFVGLRHLLDASSVEPAKLVARALFETTLAFRYLVHGGRRRINLSTPPNVRGREVRARYYYVAAERGMVYARQSLLDGRWGRSRTPRKMRRNLKLEIDEEIARLKRDFRSQSRAYGPFRFSIAGKKKVYHDAEAWYEFGFRSANVRSVRALAKRFGWVRDYELLYTAFSGIMHPRGISHDLKVTDAGAEVFHPYMAEAFELVTFFGCSWQLFTLGGAARAYTPESLPDAQATSKKVQQLLASVNSDIPDGLM